MCSSRWLAITLVIAAWPESVSAQDVEMLGRRYGTRPPASYYQEMARNPDAFRFTRGRASPLRAARTFRSARAPGGADGGPALALGPRNGPVVGDVFIPVLLGLFSDSPAMAPYDLATVQTAYFADQPGTVRDYYREVSSDRMTLFGEVADWARVSLTQSEVTQGVSGLAGSRIGDFIRELVALQVGVDWGAYDNDGPDGVPNSGDDDGYVDALAVMHPTQGGECGGPSSPGRIWAHKWSLSGAGVPVFTTDTERFPGGGGDFIKVDDYFVQGVLSCDGTALNGIGVFVHETGHAFGLPDLYDTRSGGPTHAGAGNWDLMATGTWGCNNVPTMPCHMGAWSKAMLGWVDVTTLLPDTDLGTLTLPPVETSGAVYRVDAGDGSGEYFLVENRQRIGYDQSLWSEGLLIWQIDAAAVSARWPSNTVNADDHMGVWLRQADGLDDLGQPGGGRGDAGDPFPGQSGNTAFHAASNPAARSFLDTATGLTVLDIAPSGDDMFFRLLTRFTMLTVSATPGAGGLFTVDGLPLADPPSNFILSAPFELRMIEAAAGAPVLPGERSPFSRWSDLAPSELRSRLVTTPLSDTTYVAEYSGTEYELQIALSGGANGVDPGSLVTTPGSGDLWFAPGLDVEVTAVPQTGFNFLGWTGGLAGQPNPASVVMNGPVQAGADFVLIYAVSDVLVAFPATVQQDLQLAVENGTDPVSWSLLSGTLPEGIAFSSDGRVTGASLDLGTFPLAVEATDALGLSGTGTVTLDVQAPSIPIAQLASPFLLSGPPLEPAQLTFLDRQGNGLGSYDLGDFRAWVLANPQLPLSAALGVLAEPRTVTLPMRLEGPKQRR